MDDDEAVNATARKMLEHLGYSVEVALDGGQAVDLYERSLEIGKPFDVVILDLTIPGGMGGKKTLERLMALDGGVRAVVSSGYSTDLVMANYREYGFRGVIAKPYRIEELSRVLNMVMMKE
jgi:CheY-like chemotaxis protein